MVEGSCVRSARRLKTVAQSSGGFIFQWVDAKIETVIAALDTALKFEHDREYTKDDILKLNIYQQ